MNCYATTLKDDLSDASLEELLSLRDIIDQRISELSTPPPKPLLIGEDIDLPFLHIKLNKFVQLNELCYTKKETGLGYEMSIVKNKKNAKYIAIYGEIKNTGTTSFWGSTGIDGLAIIDGYTYDLNVFPLNDEIEPFDTSLFYLYALVPNELANSFTSCIFQFGFDENLTKETLLSKDFEKYDYRYEIKLK